MHTITSTVLVGVLVVGTRIRFWDFLGFAVDGAVLLFFVELSVVNVELYVFNARILTPIRAGLTGERAPPMFYCKY